MPVAHIQNHSTHVQSTRFRATFPFLKAHGQAFDIRLPYELMPSMPMQVLHPWQVCSPGMNMKYASCVRSIGLKLQDLWLGKLLTLAFGLPAGRLLLRRHYNSATVVLMNLGPGLAAIPPSQLATPS